MAPSGFGPRVIGEEDYEEEQETLEQSRHVFGERVVGEKAEEPSLQDDEPEESSSSQEPTLEERLPEGYDATGSGGWYTLGAPDGSTVENPETGSGKWQGKDTVVKAAKAHQAQQEAEAKEEAEEEAETEERWDDEAAAEASIEEVREALEANNSTELIDRFTRAELTREGPVRSEVLDAIRDAEERREDPRDEVFSTLESLRPDAEDTEE